MPLTVAAIVDPPCRFGSRAALNAESKLKDYRGLTVGYGAHIGYSGVG
jgi:hypothetical protein